MSHFEFAPAAGSASVAGSLRQRDDDGDGGRSGTSNHSVALSGGRSVYHATSGDRGVGWVRVSVIVASSTAIV
ncbi:MAG: hypothetical protein OXK79_01545 [Chloroflexota bacterium]|nr:hypothetical protein [Spirochaetaceae bacterium]MDE2822175.1 hypothetical protein [Chloroflexota bacterium]